jgi:hypothetical protein
MRTREAYKGLKPSYSRKQFENAQSMLGKSLRRPLRQKKRTQPVG